MRSRPLVVLTAAAALFGAGMPAASASGPQAGTSGAFTLDTADDLKGYDVAVDPATGTAYVGWIAQTPIAANPGVARTVKLCVLPVGASACQGGIPSTDGLGPSSASGLHVVFAAGKAQLVWFHDTSPGSVNGPRGGRIAVTSLTPAGTLAPAADLSDAASFGQLFDAAGAPDGTVWAVTAGGSVPTSVEVGRVDGSARQTVASPVGLDAVHLAFTSAGAGVLSGVKYGSVSDPVLISGQSANGAAFPAFGGLAGTSAPSADLATVNGTVRLVTIAPSTNVTQVAAAWKGTSFGKPKKTGYTHNCPDLATSAVGDSSGRVVYAAYACSNVVVGNLIQGGAHSKVVSFGSGGTVTYAPVAASAPSGRGRVVWSIEGSGSGHVLRTASVLLPGVPLTSSTSRGAGHVTVTAPGPCLPRVSATLSAKAGHGSGWKLSKLTLKLGGKTVKNTGTVDGSKLSAGKSTKVKATATFTKLTAPGVSKTVSASTSVLACPSP